MTPIDVNKEAGRMSVGAVTTVSAMVATTLAQHLNQEPAPTVHACLCK